MKELVEGAGLNALALFAPPPLKFALAAGYLSYKFLKNGNLTAGEALAALSVLAPIGLASSPLLRDPKLARCVQSLFTETESYRRLIEATRALKTLKETEKSAELIVKTQAYQDWISALRAFEREAGLMLQNRSYLERALRANPLFNSLSKSDQQRLLTKLFDDEAALIRALDVAQSNLKREIAENAPKAIQRQMNKEVDETFKRLRKKARRKKRKDENKRDGEESKRKQDSSDKKDERKLKIHEKRVSTVEDLPRTRHPIDDTRPTYQTVNGFRAEGRKNNVKIASFYVRENTGSGLGYNHKGLKKTAFGDIDDIDEISKVA